MTYTFKTHKVCFLLMLLIGCFSFKSNSQNDTTIKLNKNFVSVDPILPLFGTFQLHYERTIKTKFSFGLSLGYKGSSGLFEITKIDFDRFNSEELNFSGYKAIPEFRWYFQKSKIGLNGLYAGAYYKYQNGDADLKGIYTSVEDEISDIFIEANLKSSVFGLQVGYKWEMKSGFFIDFVFAGPGISLNTIELKEVEPVPEAFYDDLSEFLRDIGIIDFIDPDFRVDGNQKTKITLPAWRYGIKLGYSF